MSKQTELADLAADLAGSGIPAADLASTLDLSSKTVTLPAGTGGKVLQVVSTSKTDVFSMSSSSWVDVTGLSASITPSSVSNKILCIVTGNGGTNGSVSAAARLVRDSTPIQVGDTASGFESVSSASLFSGSADGNNGEAIAISVLDSPSTTSAVTYKVQLKRLEASGTVRVNALGNDNASASYSQRSASNITLMEISA